MNTTDQKALQAYLLRAVLAAQNDVMPALLDLISGETPEQIDASVEMAKAKTTEILANIQRARQAQAPADQQWRQANGEGYGNDAALAERVAGMSLLEYSRERASLTGQKSTLDFLSRS